MRLLDVTKENWNAVISLTTMADRSHPLVEEFVASNAYSLVQACYEGCWTVKAIEAAEGIVGFAMYGVDPDDGCFELCRFMIDARFQGRGYGKAALGMIIEAMRAQFGCEKIFLSTDPENARGIRLYTRFGFRPTGESWDGEAVYCLAPG